MIEHSLWVFLSPDLKDAMPSAASLHASWHSGRVWPLPDELPDEPVIVALQEVLAADAEDREDALDELDVTLEGAAESYDPWVLLARIEAERMLDRAAYDEAMQSHFDSLMAWAETGPEGKPPASPDPWAARAHGERAEALAQRVDETGADPLIGDLARLTAAASWLDWTADSIHEEDAVAVLFDVLDQSDDPDVRIGAVDLLVGTRAELPVGALAELEALLPGLPAEVAVRLSWFVADLHLDADRSADALRVLDVGVELGSELDDPSHSDVFSKLKHAQVALQGHIVGPGGDTVPEALDALAWHCLSQLVNAEDPWVSDGVDYAGTLLVLPTGAEWREWTDENPHRDCMVENVGSLPEPLFPTRIRVEVRRADHGLG